MPTVELDRSPSLVGLYARSVVSALRGGDGLPEEELVLGDVEIDRGHLARYARVCGYRVQDHLPPTYLHVVAFPLAIQLMTEPVFPFPLVGLIHIANRITHHRPVHASERPTVNVRTADLRPHRKGTQFDVLVDAAVDGETVWSETRTYLKRGDGGGEGGDGGGEGRGDGGGGAGSEDRIEAPDREPVAHWHVPADTGRRYAAVSGDRNPIHLHPLTAKLFGFPRQIAHGMWTAARCLAALEGRLPERFEVDVRFLRPLVLPAKVAFSCDLDGRRWVIAVDSVDGDDAHLRGVLDVS